VSADYSQPGTEPPVTDNAWLELAPVRSGWVRQAEPDDHRCDLPMREVRLTALSADAHADHPDGNPGDLWRCTCGALWEIRDMGGVRGRMFLVHTSEWQRASLWTRLTWWWKP
jgi:hypothetical protein